MATRATDMAGGNDRAPDAPRRARSAEAKDLVRQALIDAGRQLMAGKDGQMVSLRGIARHAGYSPGVIYRYFPDRDALFLAVRDGEMANFIDAVEAEMDLAGDAEVRLHAIADRAFDYSRQQIAAFGMNSLALSGQEIPGDGGDGHGAKVYDFAPSGARIHAFFERTVADVIAARGGRTAPASTIAVAATFAAITGSVLLPGGSGHGMFPDGRAVMHGMLDALIADWGR